MLPWYLFYSYTKNTDPSAREDGAVVPLFTLAEIVIFPDPSKLADPESAFPSAIFLAVANLTAELAAPPAEEDPA